MFRSKYQSFATQQKKVTKNLQNEHEIGKHFWSLKSSRRIFIRIAKALNLIFFFNNSLFFYLQIVFFAVIAAVYSAPAELEIKKPEVPELVKDAITEMKTEELNRDKRTLLAAVPSIAPITPIVTSAIAPITARFYTEPA